MRCPHCLQEKTVEDFARNVSRPSGRQSWCRACFALLYDPRRFRNLRIDVLLALGGVCARCGFDDIRALQVDHINGGGNRDRRENGGHKNIYNEIVRGGVEGYQLLCANCNWIKRDENNELPRPRQPANPSYS